MSKREIPQVAKDLIAARKLIEDPANHCQRQLTFYCSLTGNTAYCALGAVNVVTEGDWRHEFFSTRQMSARVALDRAAHCLYELSEAVFVNNELGHAATLRMFDHAISTAIAEANAS